MTAFNKQHDKVLLTYFRGVSHGELEPPVKVNNLHRLQLRKHGFDPHSALLGFPRTVEAF